MRRALLLLAIAGLAIPAANAGQFLIVTKSAAGVWAFQDAESISVNGKDKLRSAPLPATAYDSKTIGKLGEVQLSSFTVIRRSADGLILARTGDPGNWQLLLPEATNAKTAEPAAQLWSGSTIAAKADRKDKTPASISLEDLYAIVPGRDAAVSAAWLATEIRAHQVPGMAEAEAFRQMLAMLPAAAKSYPDGAASKTMSDFVSTSRQIRGSLSVQDRTHCSDTERVDWSYIQRRE